MAFTSPGSRSGRKRSELLYWVELIAEAGINVSRPVSIWRAISTALSITNRDIAIVPDGTGGFGLRVPDGTTAGGNKGGTYCLDLQIMDEAGGLQGRNNANQVAGGLKNFLVGGSRNSVSEITPNTITYSGIVGGNNCSITTVGGFGCDSGVILGATSSSITHAAAGANNPVLLGGESNSIAGGNYGAILGGFQNALLSPTTYATIIGGRQNTVVSGNTAGLSSGYYAAARSCTASRAHGALSNGGVAGHAQYGRYPINYQTTAIGTFTITQGTAAPSATNQPGGFPALCTVGFTGTLIGTSGGIGAGVREATGWTFAGLFCRDSTGAMYFVGAPTQVNLGTSVAPAGTFVGATLGFALDAVNGCLQIQVTTTAATTSVWSGFVECAERL